MFAGPENDNIRIFQRHTAERARNHMRLSSGVALTAQVSDSPRECWESWSRLARRKCDGRRRTIDQRHFKKQGLPGVKYSWTGNPQFQRGLWGRGNLLGRRVI